MKNNLLKNSVYNLLTGVVRIILGIATVPVLIRSLGVQEYGLWTLASAVIGVVTLAEGGLSTATTIFVSQDLDKEDVDSLSQSITISVGGMLILATTAFFVLYFANNQIVQLYPNLNYSESQKLLSALRISGFTVWAKLLQQVLVGIQQAYQRYALINITNTASSIVTALGLMTISFYSGNIIELMHWQALTSILFLLIYLYSFISLLRFTNIRPNLSIKKIMEVGKYSTTIWFTSLGGVMFTKVDRLIIGNILGVNSLGVYSAITDVAAQINIISGLAAQPLLPMLSSWFSKGNFNVNKGQQDIRRSIQLNSYISLGMGTCLLMLDYPVMNFLISKGLTKEYLLTFFVITVIYSLYSVNSVSYYMLLACKSANISMIIQLSSGILSLSLIYIGASFYGLIGACLGNIGYLGVFLFSLFAAKRINIPVSRLFQWLFPSFIWFSITLLLFYWTIDNLSLRALCLLLQACTLIILAIYQYDFNNKDDKISLD